MSHYEDDADDLPYMVEEPESDLDDEDADLYLPPHDDSLRPVITDLPWVGESPRQTRHSGSPTLYGNDRMVVVEAWAESQLSD